MLSLLSAVSSFAGNAPVVARPTASVSSPASGSHGSARWAGCVILMPVSQQTEIDLDEGAGLAGRPLADRMRPARLSDYVGQSHILGPDKPLARALAAAGDNRGALAVCDAYLASHSFHVAVAACRALVLNETGSSDTTARLLGLETFVRLEGIAPPVAFGAISDFNQALSRETMEQFTPEYDPALRVVEGGLQSGERFVNPGVAVALLMERIDEAVREFTYGVDASDSHPFLARTPRKWRLKGYSTELFPDGHIHANIRPEAWMSGLYIANSEGAPEVTLGVPPASWNFAADPISRTLYPEAGEMLLYPSHVYCGVKAGSNEGCLLYAFQIVRE